MVAGYAITPFYFNITMYLKHKQYKSVDNSLPSKTLQDIESHIYAKHSYINREDLINWGHETTHGINSWVGLNYKKKQALYCLNDRLAVLDFPENLRIRDFAEKIPTQIRSGGYETYITGAIRDWDDNPLYLLNEWIAYCNGNQVGFELLANKRDLGRLLPVNRTVEIMQYSIIMVYFSPVKYHNYIRWFMEEWTDQTLYQVSELFKLKTNDFIKKDCKNLLGNFLYAKECKVYTDFAKIYLKKRLELFYGEIVNSI